MPVKPLEIFCHYDKQRFSQFGSMNCANWYGIRAENGKKQQAMYPTMGRKHIEFLNVVRLVFDDTPRFLFKTIQYAYVVVGTRVYQFDSFYNIKLIGNVRLTGDIWADYLPVDNLVYILMTDGATTWLITENGSVVTMVAVTDSNAPPNPAYVKAFGSRFVVSKGNTPNYYLTQINLDGGATGCFTFGLAPNEYPLTNRASGVIRQITTLHNQLYIFTDYTTDVWSNIASQTQLLTGDVVSFPWKLNTSYNWDYGIADPHSLDTSFGMMVWLAKNEDGLVAFMVSNGQQPVSISTQAINVILQNQPTDGSLNPFLIGRVVGFLFQYEDSIFYRVLVDNLIDIDNVALNNEENCLEFNFDTKTWHRCLELDGSPNRILDHIYFNNLHIVSLQNDNALYQMAGNIYYNEDYNPETAQFTVYPMYYELVTPHIFSDTAIDEPGCVEFITDYVEIDFVYGDGTYYPPQETFAPHIELYISDDGGITFLSADNREFSAIGAYRWRMRWDELGASRNRVYKLKCVSMSPIVILGAVHNVRRSSGGAN